MKFIYIILLFNLAACNSVFNPKPYGITANMLNGAPKGSPTFRYGWKQGCNSGMAAYGSMHYKLVYDFEYDPGSIQSPEYKRAWEMGFRHCRWYTATWLS